jgi:phage terminase large subunit-like protein
MAGTRFKLRPWQREAIEAIYSEASPIRTAILSMGRKAGKTGFASAIALCAART